LPPAFSGLPQTAFGRVDTLRKPVGRLRFAKPTVSRLEPTPACAVFATLPRQDYFGFFSRWRLRRRTPRPPPFSAMNSTPRVTYFEMIVEFGFVLPKWLIAGLYSYDPLTLPKSLCGGDILIDAEQVSWVVALLDLG
jgi:hypothetical protein